MRCRIKRSRNKVNFRCGHVVIRLHLVQCDVCYYERRDKFVKPKTIAVAWAQKVEWLADCDLRYL
jgi:hypothetical protein